MKRYLAGERVQVLVAFNQSTHLSVRAMNEAIAPLVNPREKDKYNLSLRRMPALWDGDRVIITKNDQKRNCSNGDVGILRIISSDDDGLLYQVHLEDGRCPVWEDLSGALRMTPAYALTVHKSQGSEYDTILFPVSREMSGMLTRNLLYTAISRGKKRVILFGSKEALNIAMQKLPHRRRSMLVQKTRIAMCTIA